MAQRNTAYFYVHGEANLFFRVAKVGAGPFNPPNALLGSKDPAFFLGHTEQTPEPGFENNYKPVFSSRTGEFISADDIYQGQDVKIALKLNRFDYDAVTALKAAPRYGRGAPAGTMSRLDIGMLHQRNGGGFEFWIRHGFHGTVNALAYPNLPIGTYFPSVKVLGTYPKNLNRDAAFVQILLQASWIELPGGDLVCYTQDATYFKSLPDPG